MRKIDMKKRLLDLLVSLSLAAALLVAAIPARAQSEFETPTLGKTVPGTQVMCQNGSNQAVPCSATTPMQIAGSISSTLTPFAPSGVFGSLTATAVTSASTALPTNTGTVEFSNPTTAYVSCIFSSGAATGIVNGVILPPGSVKDIGVVGFNNVACIDQTGSTGSNQILMAGGSGNGSGFGGGGGSGSSGAVYGPTANGSAAANPPILMGGTATGGATGNVANATILPGNSATTTQPAVVVADPNLLLVAQAPLPVIAGTAPTTQTAVSTGQTTKLQTDLNGNIYIAPAQITTLTPPSNTGYSTSANQITGTQYGNQANWLQGTSGNVTGTTQTTIIGAPGANKLYVTNVQCFNSGSTSSTITLNDGASTVLFNPAGSGVVASFLTPLIVGATTALKFTPGSSSTNQWCNAQAYNAS
jgi:hypothetical protein